MGTRIHGLALLALCAALLGAQASARPQRYEIGPAPDWVARTPTPDALSVASSAAPPARAILLLDRQIRADAAVETYTRIVSRIVNPAGITDGSQLTIDFDPALDHLRVHAVTLHRGPNTIDELQRGTIQVLQRESGLEHSVLDGSLTFLLLLADVRVGDTIDYSYTIERQRPDFGNRLFTRFVTRWADPVALLHYRVLTRTDVPLKLLNRDGRPPTRRIDGPWQTLDWSWRNVPAELAEADQPEWHEQYPTIEVAQFADWREVAALLAPLYSVPPQTTRALAEAVAQLRASTPTDAGRALAAIRFVQEEVRYTGIELGVRAYRPAAPGDVLRRRFGDCKDKTLLAVALLRSLGVDAWPALVSARWRARLPAHLPSPGAFDHAIVRVSIDGATYWFDVTATAQGGTLSRHTRSPFGAALVLAPWTADLEAIPPEAADTPLIAATTVFDLRAGVLEDATLNASTTYRGSEADRMRRVLRETTPEELGTQYLNYYKGLYAEIRALGPPRIEDDVASNVLRVDEAYRAGHVFAKGDDGKREFEVEADVVGDYLRAPTLPARSTPLALPFPASVAHAIVIRLPEQPDVNAATQRIEAPGFSYDSRVRIAGRDVRLDYRYRGLADHVPVGDLAEHLRQRERARLDTHFALDIPSEAPASGRADGRAVLAPGVVGALLGLALAAVIWRGYGRAGTTDNARRAGESLPTPETSAADSSRRLSRRVFDAICVAFLAAVFALTTPGIVRGLIHRFLAPAGTSVQGVMQITMYQGVAGFLNVVVALLLTFATRRRPIGGWLLLYCLGLARNVTDTLLTVPAQFWETTAGSWDRVASSMMALAIGAWDLLLAVEAALAVLLLARRQERYLRMLMTVLVAQLPCALAIAICAPSVDEQAVAVVAQSISSLLWSGAWYWYFRTSTRVRLLCVEHAWSYAAQRERIGQPTARECGYLVLRAAAAGAVIYAVSLVLLNRAWQATGLPHVDPWGPRALAMAVTPLIKFAPATLFAPIGRRMRAILSPA